MVVVQIYFSETVDRSLVFGASGERVDKEVEQLPGQVSRGCGTCADNRYHILAAEVRLLAIDRFGPVVVLVGIDPERVGCGPQVVPASECARDLLYVILGIVLLSGDDVID